MRFEDKVRALLMLCDGRVTSWIRSKWSNDNVGGAKNSMHMVGLAVDIVLDDRASDLELFKQMAARLKLFLLDETDHIHIHELNP